MSLDQRLKVLEQGMSSLTLLKVRESGGLHSVVTHGQHLQQETQEAMEVFEARVRREHAAVDRGPLIFVTDIDARL